MAIVFDAAVEPAALSIAVKDELVPPPLRVTVLKLIVSLALVAVLR